MAVAERTGEGVGVIGRQGRGQRSRALQVTVNKFAVSDGKPLKSFEQINDMI